MIPVDQEFIHRPDEGQHGDCFRAVLASLMELPLQDVPHFLHDGCSSDTFHRRINAFLDQFNMTLLVFDASTFNISAWIDQSGVRDLWHEVSGMTERGVLHSCVGHNGHVVHDPHPSKAGLIDVQYYSLLVSINPKVQR
jgi:hypothetical protein